MYHLDRARRHLASLHTFGVDGLDVVKDGDRAVVVKPGIAIDSAGREIVLRDAQRLVVSDAGSGDVVYVVIAYSEDFDAADRATDAENYTRRTEFALLRTVTSVPAADGSVLVLARCEI